MKTLATLGCLGAATAFGRGDYLRRAWSLHALGFGLLVATDLAFAPPLHTSVTDCTRAQMMVRGTLVLVSNASSVLAAWMLFGTLACTSARCAGIAQRWAVSPSPTAGAPVIPC